MFEGAYTALVTPFNQDLSVDFGKLKALVAVQASAGIDGIVAVGTTGESPTLSYAEHNQVIDAVIESAEGRLKVVAGTGANSTAEALELTRYAKESGADGTLQVTPYYNKPTAEGLYRHFTAVADLGLPVMLYNVPGRAGQEIDVDTVVRLAEHPHVVAVKEAAGPVSVDRTSAILTRCSINVMSGDDALTLPMMAMGGGGVVSVASNLIPQVMADMVHAATQGEWSEALALHRTYYGLFNGMFIDTNPIPVKAAMAMCGMLDATYRLPLCELTESQDAELKSILEAACLLQTCQCEGA
jgi:4-hydroxy-tetrahydrodipicolinate synthase